MMKSILYILFFFSIPILGFAQTQSDTCNWEVPNSITMDCKYGNDYQFKMLSNCELEDFALLIYNRWGEVVFESKNIDNYWDASKKESETFVWIIEGKYKDGSEFKKKGTVILIR